MEILILGMLLGAGAAKRKSVTKALAKGYFALTETSAHLREDLHEAINEAKTEQEQERSDPEMAGTVANTEITALHEEVTTGSNGAAPTLTLLETEQASDASGADLAVSTPAALDATGTETPKPGLSIIKGVARGFLKVTEMTRSAAAHVREDLRDAVEEAKYERELAASKRTALQISEPVASPADMVDHSDPVATAAPIAPPVKKTLARPAPKPAATAPKATHHTQKNGSAAGTTTAAPAAKKPRNRAKVVKTEPIAVTPEPVVSQDVPSTQD